MRNILKALALSPLVLSLFLPQEAFAQRIRTWQELLKEKKAISICVEDIVNSTGDGKIDTDALKSGLTKALSERKSVDFELVPDPAQADIILKSDIIEYYWTEEDPLDQVHSSIGMAYDMMKKEHYARMTVDFSILYVPDKKIIWNEKIKATITDPVMTESESYKMIEERIVPVFMRNLFKKRSRRFSVHNM